MDKIIAHIDLNAFFATAEVIKNPSLKGKPILVGHEGRSGIVSTCSYEARKRGCHSGQPTFQALKCCPEAIVVHPDYHFYKIMSNAFFAYIRRYSSIIEAASIDECYVDMTKCLSKEKDKIAFLRKLQFGLKEETGLSCSIGIAPTKWLAKMGSDMKKPMGLTFIGRDNLESTIYKLQIESFWGIGKKTSPLLRSQGINTIGDLRKKIDDESVKSLFGKFYFTVSDWIRGYGSDEIDIEPFDPKSVGVSETLMADITSYYEAMGTLKRIAEEVSSRAKQSGKEGYTISLTVKDNTFKVYHKSTTLAESTNSADIILEKATSLFKKYFDEKLTMRLLGITLEKLVNPRNDVVQMTLWNYEKYQNLDKTKLLIDKLNSKMDKPMLTRARDVRKKDENGSK